MTTDQQREPGPEPSDFALRDIQILRDLVLSATTSEMLFGELEGADAEKLAALNSKYFVLAKRCKEATKSPDPKAVELGQDTFEALSEIYRAAQESIRSGSYGQGAKWKVTSGSQSLGTIAGALHTYSLVELIADGDVALVYRAEYQNEKGEVANACIKVAKDCVDNPLVENEQEILATLNHISLPKFLEGFELPDGRSVSVTEFAKGLTFHDLRESNLHGDGLQEPNYHIGWVLERTLAVLGYLHSQGIVHGSVEPAHLIVQPDTHNVVLVDFCWATRDPKEGDHVQIAQEYYSPPEVYEKETPHPAIDIYGLGKSAVYLLGGDPEYVQMPDTLDLLYVQFLERMTAEDPQLRSHDAFQLAHHLLVIRAEVCGAKRPFLALVTDRGVEEQNLGKPE